MTCLVIGTAGPRRAARVGTTRSMLAGWASFATQFCLFVLFATPHARSVTTIRKEKCVESVPTGTISQQASMTS